MTDTVTTVSRYGDFIAAKQTSAQPVGFDGDVFHYDLFPHQVDLTAWALRRGRAAIFADTGLGKSRMQIAWADQVCRKTGRDVLILAPLAVAEQTREEAARNLVAATKRPDDLFSAA